MPNESIIKIKERADQLVAEYDILYREVRLRCEHPDYAVTRTPYCDDNASPSYTYGCKCDICGKYWFQAQSDGRVLNG